eukprot:CAMPEP_0170567240 /NCGR_PEP_ID=MMETSP0211-20121228/80352_1 /TAXON_ID=311385 /ORGANISM="Pseudokeronopsis sp., Strain OXSARD2" /LENGTH=65 /DNA_ID=CAMNT_0010888639 /DNA_START=583 /DNA_END=780 /DNA_ORIENTATION=+
MGEGGDDPQWTEELYGAMPKVLINDLEKNKKKLVSKIEDKILNDLRMNHTVTKAYVKYQEIISNK